MAKPFKGVINLDIRDSTPDWSPYLAGKAPEGSPNVLIVLYDDTGLPRGRRSAGGSRCRRWIASPATG